MIDLLTIISKLWSVIYDMRMFISGSGNKTIVQIDARIEELTRMCEPYADAVEDGRM